MSCFAITNGALRTNVFARFATNPHTPGTNLSLYRYSRGHGGLQCSACHGSTHAEYPSAFTNDNLQELAFQGHEGTIAECDRCHGSQPANSTAGLGPHGLHPVGDTWAQSHADAARALGLATCRACHGANDRGTVLSRAFGTRTVSTKYGSRTFWRGYPVGCYNCHDGTGSSDPTTRGFPTVASRTASATASVPAAIALSVSNGAPRIVSQPAHGLVILYGSIATNIPDAGFSGTDRFTFAANNGYNDSSLATVTVAVAPAPDTDSDGVPDGWVQQHFGHPTGMSNDLSRAEDDPDQDRHTNREELLAGTDPRDARSCVRVFPLAWPGSLSTTTRVAVVSHLGQRFQFERTDALESGVWTPVGNPVWGRTDATEPAPPPGASPPFLRAVVVP